MTQLSEIIAPADEGAKAVVRRWLKAVGEPVRAHEPVVELETDKVAVEVAAESDGVLAEILIDAGADAQPGAVLGRLSAAVEAAAARKVEAGTPASVTPASVPEPAAAAAWSAPAARIAAFDPALRLSPSVRRLLIESGLDPTGLVGAGRDGRLTRHDVEQAIARREAGAATAPVTGSQSKGRPRAVPGAGCGRHFDPARLHAPAIAEHMSRSVATAPHVTAIFEADFSAITAHRRAHKAAFEARGVALTYTAYIVAAAVEAMKVAPQVNSRWFEDRLEVYADVNVGVGTALEDKGLIVPVIHRAQTLSLSGDRRTAAGPDRQGARGQARARRRQGRHLLDLQPRRVGLAGRRAHHHQPAAVGDPGRRQAGEAGRGARGRRRGHHPDPPDGLCLADHRPPRPRRPPDQRLADPLRRGAGELAGGVASQSAFIVSRS